MSIYKGFVWALVVGVFGVVLGPLGTVLAGDTIALHYAENAQFEITGPTGIRVLIDVHEPKDVSRPPTERDILLTSNSHFFHLHHGFSDTFPGKKLQLKVGELQAPGIRIRSLASARYADDAFKDVGGSNYIFIIDMAGTRIVHFGCIGQRALTDAQIAAIGAVDIAILPLSTHTGVTVKNQRGFHMMDQVKPRLIIPTHIYELAGTEVAASKWTGYNAASNTLTINPDRLPDSTAVVLMGLNASREKLPLAAF